MRAIDTNVLVFAQIKGSSHHHQALSLLRELAEGAAPFAIPWPCVYEFLRIVTHPRVFHPPVPLKRPAAPEKRCHVSLPASRPVSLPV